jgi:hypothetical protein
MWGTHRISSRRSCKCSTTEVVEVIQVVQVIERTSLPILDHLDHLVASYLVTRHFCFELEHARRFPSIRRSGGKCETPPPRAWSSSRRSRRSDPRRLSVRRQSPRSQVPMRRSRASAIPFSDRRRFRVRCSRCHLDHRAELRRRRARSPDDDRGLPPSRCPARSPHPAAS